MRISKRSRKSEKVFGETEVITILNYLISRSESVPRKMNILKKMIRRITSAVMITKFVQNFISELSSW